MIALLIGIICIALLQGLVGGWWWIIVIPFVFGVLQREFAWRWILAKGAAVALLWLVVILFQYLTSAERIVDRVGTLMGLSSPWLLIPLASLLAFLVSGLATYSGMALRRLFFHDRQIA